MEAIMFRWSSLKNLNVSDLNLLSKYYPPVLEPRAVLCLLGSLQSQPSGRELSVICFAVSHLKVSFGPKKITTAKKPGWSLVNLNQHSHCLSRHRRHWACCQRSWHKHPLWIQRLSSIFNSMKHYRGNYHSFIRCENWLSLRLWNCAS